MNILFFSMYFKHLLENNQLGNGDWTLLIILIIFVIIFTLYYNRKRLK